jgi:hypothetical protein
MSRPRSTPAATQLAFTFEAPARPTGEAALAALERQVCAAVGKILKEDPRSRFEIAAALSTLADEEVSKAMLDAYASEAREGHNISVARFLGLIAATERYDVLDSLLTKIGARCLVGAEVLTAELGSIDREMAALADRKKHLQSIALPIRRGAENP